MKYFLDTEFLEGTQKKLFGKTKPTIDLISIGLFAEDGSEYYAISKDFNLKEAWNRYDLKPDIDNGGMKKVYWIRENVLKPIFNELVTKYALLEDKAIQLRSTSGYNPPYKFDYKTLKKLISLFGKTNKQISTEIKNFVYSENRESGSQMILESFIPNIYPEPEFYTYYGAYDWVVFCQLFGTMMNLPKGFPMYCIDLKQMLDEKENSLKNEDGTIELVSEIIPEHGCAMVGLFKSIKDFGTYPKQTNEHNALADAKWNHELYKFLTEKL